MSRSLLSKVDYRKEGKEDMLYLKQPRGSGTGWVFRMATPPDLVGIPNPWDGEPLRKTIMKGLGTRQGRDRGRTGVRAVTGQA